MPRLAPALLVAALATVLHATWRQWGDVIADCGRELEVPRQLTEGQVLYADLHYYYGPLAPYLNAVLYRIFGVRAGVLMTAGVLSAAAMCWVVYRLARRLATAAAGTVAALAFLAVCAFGQYYVNGAFNWALPYSYAATYGMLAAASSLLLLVRHVQDSHVRDLHGSVICLGLAALCKLEATLPAAMTHLVFLVTWRDRRAGRLGPYAVVAAVTAAVYGVFTTHMGPAAFGQSFRDVMASGATRSFLTRHMGLEHWTQSLATLLESGVVLGLLVLVPMGLAHLARSPAPSAWLGRALAVPAAAVPALVYSRLPVRVPFAIAPVVIAIVLAWLGRRWWREPAERAALVPHILLWVFALGCLARMPLTTGALLYGFYLLPIPLTAFAVLWFSYVPGWPARSALGSWLAAWAGAGAFAGIVVAHEAVARHYYELRTALVDTPRGRIWLLDGIAGLPIGEANATAIRRLAEFPPSTRVMAVPEGTGLAFFAGLASWDGMHSFLPVEIAGASADQDLVDALARTPPEVVVRVGIDLGEYGSRGFGVDYATRTWTWIAANYDIDTLIPPGNYIAILRRKDVPRPVARDATD